MIDVRPSHACRLRRCKMIWLAVGPAGSPPLSLPWLSITGVGLPEGTMGNSEVGHQNIGAGRIVDQESVRITKQIRDGEFYDNVELGAAVTNCLQNGTFVGRARSRSHEGNRFTTWAASRKPRLSSTIKQRTAISSASQGTDGGASQLVRNRKFG